MNTVAAGLFTHSKGTALSILVALTVLAGLLLVGCAGQPSNTPSPSPSQPAAAGGENALTVVDSLGRTVEFSEPPQRIVLAGKSTLTIANTLYLFPQARERVVALVAGRQNPGDFLRIVDPEFDQKTILEVDAGPEQIAPLRPDAVILRSFMADGLGTALEELDIPVVYVDLETPEQYARDLTTLGQLLGDEARAAEIQTFYQSRLDQIAEASSGATAGQKPRILLIQHSDKGGQVAFNVPPVSWMQTTEAELAGGVPVWTEATQGGGWTVVNLEQIAAWDPNQIFVISYGPDSSGIAADLRQDPQWRALSAAKAGQIYGFAGDIYSWDQPDPRWILGTLWLAGKVQPDEFSDLDMMAEVFTFYEQLYGLDNATVQERIVPTLTGDVE